MFYPTTTGHINMANITAANINTKIEKKPGCGWYYKIDGLNILCNTEDSV